MRVSSSENGGKKGETKGKEFDAVAEFAKLHLTLWWGLCHPQGCASLQAAASQESRGYSGLLRSWTAAGLRARSLAVA